MNINQKNYYEVIAKCGHVGRKFYIPIKFAVCTINGKEAARQVRLFPRVKHNHKDAILSVKKINYSIYLEINKSNNEDPYLKCHSKQEQKRKCNLSGRLCIDEHNQEKKIDKSLRRNRVSFKLRKTKELLNSYMEDEYEYEYLY